MTARSQPAAGLHASSAGLPVEGSLPSFDGATGWLNSAPLTAADLAGKIVLVNFWTYTCVNWLRQLPYLRAWAGKYADHGLAVIGVHTPEFSFEHSPGNVRQAVHEMGITYPVALDSHYAVWRAIGNHYWPALYFADAQGQIRHHHFGEGEYEQSEMVIQQLLAGAGTTDQEQELVSVDARGVEAPADWATLGSAENYTGYERTEGFASPGGTVPGEPHTYSIPARLGLNQWALAGDATMDREAATLNAANGQLACRFHARDLNLVMGPAAAGASPRFRVGIDGRPPGDSRGSDVDADGNGTLAQQRVYQLIRQPGPVEDRTFDITFADPGAQAYCFTFG
jgi:thiol-disulfide isomerase/thioredoxin